MQAWIRIGQPLEPVISDYKRIFDAWEDGGVCGFVFGRTLFSDSQGQFTIPALSRRSRSYAGSSRLPGRSFMMQIPMVLQREDYGGG